jgi:hypothetical protein
MVDAAIWKGRLPGGPFFCEAIARSRFNLVGQQLRTPLRAEAATQFHRR